MIIELLVLAVTLSMDAFAVAICKGLSMQKITAGKCVTVGAWFGGFQALMPAIGFVLAGILTRLLGEYLEPFTGWIAFILLFLIGAGMIKEALEKKEDGCECGNGDGSVCAKVMFPMAVATSIDAMVVGVGYGLRPDMGIPEVLFSVIMIGVITFALSALGVKIGNVFGDKYEKKAQLAGGIVLCLLGIKNVLDQYGVLDAAWGWFTGLFA